MKALIINNRIINIMEDSYNPGNPDVIYTSILSINEDIDLEDIKKNRAWKFKLVNGILYYDVDKIKNDMNKEIDAKRRLRYSIEVDPYKLEALEDDLTNDEKQALKNTAKANKAQIKLDLPKTQ